MCLSPIVMRQCESFVSDRMPFLQHCFCCTLAIAAGFLAVYLLITYLIAFAFELLWILEASAPLPTAAALLCTGYFTLALFAALLIHGLATEPFLFCVPVWLIGVSLFLICVPVWLFGISLFLKFVPVWVFGIMKNTLCLISWLFAVTVLSFPEAGMVIYMSIQYWRIESLYGITELTCWLARILANVIAIVLVQSLYAAWKDDEMVMKRLHDLSLQAVTIPRDISAFPHASAHQFHQNNAFNASVEQLQYLGHLKRAVSTPQLLHLPNNLPLLDNFCHGYKLATASEFNAAVFMPPQMFLEQQQQRDAVETMGMKKSQSLGDLRAVAMPHHHHHHRDHHHQALSLGRQAHKKVGKFGSLDAVAESENNDSHLIRNRSGFYAQPVENYGVPIYYGPLDGPDFLIYKKQIDKLSSKNSLSNASVEDVQKYRDVAL